MKPRTLLVLTVLVLALGAFILLFEKDMPSTDERTALENKLVPLEDDEVEAVVLGEGDAPAAAAADAAQPVRLERVPTPDDAEDDAPLSPSEWRLVEPFQARADATEVEALVRRLGGLERRRALDDADRAELGLDSPRAVVTLEGADGESTRVRVGEALPLGGAVVVEIERDGDAEIVEAASFPGDLLETIRRPAADWRDPQLFPGSRDAITRLVLSDAAGRRLVLERPNGDAEDGAADLRLVEPVADAADPEALNSLLASLTALEASRFVDTGAESGLTESPEEVARLEATLDGQEEPFVLTVAPEAVARAVDADLDADLDLDIDLDIDTVDPEADPVPRLVRIDSAMASDQRVLADVGFLLDALARPIETWRSLDLTSTQVFEIDAASFGGSAIAEALAVERVELERVEGVWKRSLPGGDDAGPIEIDYTAATDALYPLADARAVELTEAVEPAGEALLRVELRAGERVESMTIFGPADGRHPVRVDGRDATLWLAGPSVRQILEPIERLGGSPEELAIEAASSGAASGAGDPFGALVADPILGGLEPPDDGLLESDETEEETP